MVTDFQRNGGAQSQPIKLDPDLDGGCFFPSGEGFELRITHLVAI